MRSTLLTLVALALTTATLPSLAVAQGDPALSDLDQATEEARSVLQTERKTIVAQGLALSVAEE